MINPEYAAGARLFNAGHWWEAHEAWEAHWMRATGQERLFLQALILLAAALHKRWAHGSLSHRNFVKAVRYLETLPAHYGGVDLERLRGEVWGALNTPARCPQVPVADQD